MGGDSEHICIHFTDSDFIDMNMALAGKQKVFDVKNFISECCHVDADKIVLKYKGKVLDDNLVLSKKNAKSQWDCYLKEKLPSKQVAITEPDPEKVNQCINLGFSRTQVMNALINSNNDLEKAITLLTAKPIPMISISSDNGTKKGSQSTSNSADSSALIESQITAITPPYDDFLNSIPVDKYVMSHYSIFGYADSDFSAFINGVRNNIVSTHEFHTFRTRCASITADELKIITNFRQNPESLPDELRTFYSNLAENNRKILLFQNTIPAPTILKQIAENRGKSSEIMQNISKDWNKISVNELELIIEIRKRKLSIESQPKPAESTPIPFEYLPLHYDEFLASIRSDVKPSDVSFSVFGFEGENYDDLLFHIHESKPTVAQFEKYRERMIQIDFHEQRRIIEFRNRRIYIPQEAVDYYEHLQLDSRQLLLYSKQVSDPGTFIQQIINRQPEPHLFEKLTVNWQRITLNEFKLLLKLRTMPEGSKSRPRVSDDIDDLKEEFEQASDPEIQPDFLLTGNFEKSIAVISFSFLSSVHLFARRHKPSVKELAEFLYYVFSRCPHVEKRSLKKIPQVHSSKYLCIDRRYFGNTKLAKMLKDSDSMDEIAKKIKSKVAKQTAAATIPGNLSHVNSVPLLINQHDTETEVDLTINLELDQNDSDTKAPVKLFSSSDMKSAAGLVVTANPPAPILIRTDPMLADEDGEKSKKSTRRSYSSKSASNSAASKKDETHSVPQKGPTYLTVPQINTNYTVPQKAPNITVPEKSPGKSPNITSPEMSPAQKTPEKSPSKHPTEKYPSSSTSEKSPNITAPEKSEISPIITLKSPSTTASSKQTERTDNESDGDNNSQKTFNRQISYQQIVGIGQLHRDSVAINTDKPSEEEKNDTGTQMNHIDYTETASNTEKIKYSETTTNTEKVIYSDLGVNPSRDNYSDMSTQSRVIKFADQETNTVAQQQKQVNLEFSTTKEIFVGKTPKRYNQVTNTSSVKPDNKYVHNSVFDFSSVSVPQSEERKSISRTISTDTVFENESKTRELNIFTSNIYEREPTHEAVPTPPQDAFSTSTSASQSSWQTPRKVINGPDPEIDGYKFSTFLEELRERIVSEDIAQELFLKRGKKVHWAVADFYKLLFEKDQ